MELGEVEHEKEVLESKKQTLHPHSTCNTKIPKEHISRMHSENAVLLHNCLYLKYTSSHDENCHVFWTYAKPRQTFYSKTKFP